MTAETEEAPAASMRRGAVARAGSSARLRGAGGAPDVCVVDITTDLCRGPRTTHQSLWQPMSDPESARDELVRLARNRLPAASQSPEAPV